MAFEIDLKGLLFLVLFTTPLTCSTNIDCNGKPFYCVNSTHFMICVDLGGTSTTIDDFVIECPHNTVCHANNQFECEFPKIEEPVPLNVISVTDTNDISVLSYSTKSTEAVSEVPLTEEIKETSTTKVNDDITLPKNNDQVFDATNSYNADEITVTPNVNEIVINNDITTVTDKYYYVESTTELPVTVSITDNNRTTPLEASSIKLSDKQEDSKQNIEITTTENILVEKLINSTPTIFFSELNTKESFDLDKPPDNDLNVLSSNYTTLTTETITAISSSTEKGPTTITHIDDNYFNNVTESMIPDITTQLPPKVSETKAELKNKSFVDVENTTKHLSEITDFTVKSTGSMDIVVTTEYSDNLHYNSIPIKGHVDKYNTVLSVTSSSPIVITSTPKTTYETNDQVLATVSVTNDGEKKDIGLLQNRNITITSNVTKSDEQTTIESSTKTGIHNEEDKNTTNSFKNDINNSFNSTNTPKQYDETNININTPPIDEKTNANYADSVTTETPYTVSLNLFNNFDTNKLSSDANHASQVKEIKTEDKFTTDSVLFNTEASAVNKNTENITSKQDLPNITDVVTSEKLNLTRIRKKSNDSETLKPILTTIETSSTNETTTEKTTFLTTLEQFDVTTEVEKSDYNFTTTEFSNMHTINADTSAIPSTKNTQTNIGDTIFSTVTEKSNSEIFAKENATSGINISVPSIMDDVKMEIPNYDVTTLKIPVKLNMEAATGKADNTTINLNELPTENNDLFQESLNNNNKTAFIVANQLKNTTGNGISNQIITNHLNTSDYKIIKHEDNVTPEETFTTHIPPDSTAFIDEVLSTTTIKSIDTNDINQMSNQIKAASNLNAVNSIDSEYRKLNDDVTSENSHKFKNNNLTDSTITPLLGIVNLTKKSTSYEGPSTLIQDTIVTDSTKIPYDDISSLTTKSSETDTGYRKVEITTELYSNIIKKDNPASLAPRTATDESNKLTTTETSVYHNVIATSTKEYMTDNTSLTIVNYMITEPTSVVETIDFSDHITIGGPVLGDIVLYTNEPSNYDSETKKKSTSGLEMDQLGAVSEINSNFTNKESMMPDTVNDSLIINQTNGDMLNNNYVDKKTQLSTNFDENAAQINITSPGPWSPQVGGKDAVLNLVYNKTQLTSSNFKVNKSTTEGNENNLVYGTTHTSASVFDLDKELARDSDKSGLGKTKVEMSQSNNTSENKNTFNDNLQVTTSSNYLTTPYNVDTVTNKLSNTDEAKATTTPTNSLTTVTNKNVDSVKTLINFDCRNRTRGKYSDSKDCRKFYFCVGTTLPLVGICPNNTVFSEINKQCTKNLSHCIRNNQFYCLKEGRFSDFFKDNIYYICVKNGSRSFLRYKLQCQSNYHLDKATVKCEKNIEATSESGSSTSENSMNNKEQNGSAVKADKKPPEKEFKCKKEGTFPYPEDCAKYYVCSKNSEDEYGVKIKKCEGDKIYDKDKKKCISGESNEC